MRHDVRASPRSPDARSRPVPRHPLARSAMSTRKAASNRALRLMRVALSYYVTNGLSVAFGLFLISGAVHLFLGPFASAAAAIGVIAASPPDQPAPRRGKFLQLLPAAIIALPLFFGVQILHADPMRLGLLLVPASFLAFLGAAWGKRGIPISVAAMLAIVFSMAAPPGADGHTAIESTLYFALGAACYLIYATLANLALNAHYRVQMLADTLLSISALMRTQAFQFRPQVERGGKEGNRVGQLLRQQAALADQFQNARDIVLESPRTPRRQRWAGMLIQILEMRDHLLACGLDLELLIETPGHGPVLDALGQTLEQLSDEIEYLADCLLTGRVPRPFASHRPFLQSLQWDIRSVSAATDALPSVAILARALADRVGHIDDEILRLIALARSEVNPDLAVVRASWQMFTSPTAWSSRPFRTMWHWDAPPLRHAIRAALAIATGYAISLAMPWGTHDYWILLTIVVVLRGSLAQTIERRNSRVAGTLLGGLVAGTLLAFKLPAVVLLLVVTVAQGAAHAFAIRRYLVTAVAATILALIQAHLLNAGASLTFDAFERVVDTLIGVAIAWAFSYVLPSWERTQIPSLVRRTLDAHARHARLSLGLGQLDAVDNAPEVEWRLARREAYDSLSALVQATQRSLSEPRAARPPLEPLEHLLAHSYQLLAQLTAVKSMLLLRRGRLNAELLASPLQYSAETIERTLIGQDEPTTIPSTQADASIDLTTLPDPFERDLSPWLLRRLRLAGELATRLRGDARQILQPAQARAGMASEIR